MQASSTLLVMALIHLIFYVPLACARVAALFAMAIGAEPETALALTGASFVGYMFAAPVHLANFVVRCVRVRGFARAVLRMCCRPVLVVCPCARACGDYAFGGSPTQSTGAIV